MRRKNRVGEVYYAYRIDDDYVDAELVYLGMGQTLKGAHCIIGEQILEIK